MLTKRQRSVLDYLIACEEERFSPSFEEIAAHVGLKSKSGIHRVINELRERGFVRLIGRRRRAIEVIRRAEAEHECPLCKGTGHWRMFADRRVA